MCLWRLRFGESLLRHCRGILDHNGYSLNKVDLLFVIEGGNV